MQLCPGAAVTEEQAGARLGASEGRPCKACLFWDQAIPEAEVQRTMAAGNFDLGAAPTTKEAQAISDELYADFVSEEVDKVEMIYTKFVSLISAEPIVQTLLPLTPQVRLSRMCATTRGHLVLAPSPQPAIGRFALCPLQTLTCPRCVSFSSLQPHMHKWRGQADNTGSWH